MSDENVAFFVRSDAVNSFAKYFSGVVDLFGGFPFKRTFARVKSWRSEKRLFSKLSAILILPTVIFSAALVLVIFRAAIA